MASPVPWETVTRPGGNAPWAFFGDRRLLTTDYEWGLIFAHHVSEPKIDARHARQLAIFAGDVDAVALA